MNENEFVNSPNQDDTKNWVYRELSDDDPGVLPEVNSSYATFQPRIHISDKDVTYFV